MNTKRKRKQRGFKLAREGSPVEKSYDLCPCCYSPGCDPMARHPKVEFRLRNGLCPACGQPWDICICKSHKGNSSIKVHNNKHRKEYIERRNFIISMAESIHSEQESYEVWELLRCVKLLRVSSPETVERLRKQLKHPEIPEKARILLTDAIEHHIKISSKFFSGQ